MTRLFILAAVLSTAVSATAWGQASCDDMQRLRVNMIQEQANAAFDASAAEADETYREEFQAANAAYAQALANVEAAYDGSLYWVFKSAEALNEFASVGPIADAAAKRTRDRNAAHREWASTVSDMMSRWSASIEDAEARRSAFVGANVVLIEKQLSDCR